MQRLEEKSFDQKVDIHTWKRLFGYAFRHKKIVAQIVVVMLINAVIDVLHPVLTGYAIDNFVVPGTLEGVKLFAIAYSVIILIQCYSVFRFLERGGRLEMDISYEIRKEAFQKLQELSFSFYDKTPVGYLLARMVSDIARLSEMIAWSFVDVGWAGTYILFNIAYLFVINAKLALIILTIVPVLVLLSAYFQKRILQKQREVRRTNSRITGAFNEGIMGAMTTKTLVREEANFGEFEELTTTMKGASVKSAMLQAKFLSLVICIGAVGVALAMTFGGAMVVDGVIEIGKLATAISLTMSLFEPIQQLARVIAEFQTAQASAERVLSLIDTPCDIVEKPEVVALYGDNFQPKEENWPPIKGDIEFQHVSFSYKEGETVLDDFSIKIKAGETIALVGETGAGKSTIVNLVCRFYEPNSGKILIDGADYRDRSSLWLESSLGYVLQTPHLFSGTIEDNIKYGKKDATREEVIAAAKMVSAHDFIARFTKDYDTEVGEGGALLSTGQKQLISFARVVLADPRIFVLDEATSSIDTETEQLIQNAITTVLEGRTSFLVAHRLSTIRSADRILVIRDGKVTEQGDHRALMRQKGYYYTLYTNQFRQERQSEVLG